MEILESNSIDSLSNEPLTIHTKLQTAKTNDPLTMQQKKTYNLSLELNHNAHCSIFNATNHIHVT
jgi:hypothetical protein